MHYFEMRFQDYNLNEYNNFTALCGIRDKESPMTPKSKI